jgi:hypothetical protein
MNMIGELNFFFCIQIKHSENEIFIYQSIICESYD